MDDYGFERLELTGSMISMEFGPGGRIHMLWGGDPGGAEEREEFQFVAPPITMGDEAVEDYYPGTILLGARTHPDDPWILSRNSRAESIESDDDSNVVSFRYEFSFLEELEATGRFYEIGGRLPQIAWDLSIRNRSRRSIEIGELGFPLALNNVLEGFGHDAAVRDLFHDRVQVHKFIGGSASYIHAQRLNGLPPGLMIFPGAETRWEFYNSLPASLRAPFRWEGIPVVYVHSRAAIEREEWQDWFSGHSSTVLEPGETRTYQMRFAPALENPTLTLATCGRPAMSLFPGAVAPADVGLAIDVTGATPTRFWTDADIELETDADPEGGFCYVRPRNPGPIRIGFEDTQGRDSETHVLFTPPIEELIIRRAEWIVQHQVCEHPAQFAGAIVPATPESAEQDTDRLVGSGFGLAGGLADALYLAEKNTVFPNPEQIPVLDRYREQFLEARLRSPADGSVGSLFATPNSVAAGFGLAGMYTLTACFYESMARIASGYGGTALSVEQYLERAAETLQAMFRHVELEQATGGGAALISHVPRIIEALREVEHPAADELQESLRARWRSIASLRYPFLPMDGWSGEEFEEAWAAARELGDRELQERTFRYASSARSVSPCWWWYGSDKRWQEPGVNPALGDRGEMCLGSTSLASTEAFLDLLEKDLPFLPSAAAQLAFGSLLGTWALIDERGGASMGFCPDLGSRHFGHLRTTGDIGVALFRYLRRVGSFVLPSAGLGIGVFGCYLEVEEQGGVETFVIRPWDGVGRRVIVRQIGVEVEALNGRIVELRFDSRKRKCRVSLQNPSDKDLKAILIVKGLWGRRCRAAGEEHSAVRGTFRIPIRLPALDTLRVDIEVSE
jgi:hypothetical protein